MVTAIVKSLPALSEGNGDPSRASSSPRRDGFNAMLLRFAFDKGYHVDEEGRLWSHTGNQLHPGDDGRGYPRFTVRLPDKRCRTVLVHRLVGLQKFGERIFDGALVLRHLDGNSFNFRPSNIEIGTEHENSLDRPPEERQAHAARAASFLRSLTSDQAAQLCAMYRRGVRLRDCAKAFGIALSTASYIVNGLTYPELQHETFHD